MTTIFYKIFESKQGLKKSKQHFTLAEVTEDGLPVPYPQSRPAYIFHTEKEAKKQLKKLKKVLDIQEIK